MNLTYLIVICVICVIQHGVQCHPAQPGDRIKQGFRDVVTDDDDRTGKDYEYSSEEFTPNKFKKLSSRRSPDHYVNYVDEDFISWESDSYHEDFKLSEDQITLERPPAGRSKRAAIGKLQAFRDQLLLNMNEYREEQGLPEFEIDPTLEQGAQEWAAELSRTLTLSHSCDDCPDYSEILAKRKSSKSIPQGVAASNWLYSSWFVDDEDKTYAAIIDDPAIHKVGFGVTFTRDTRDKSYYSIAVARFARIH